MLRTGRQLMNESPRAVSEMEAAWTREATRLHARYMVEVVEACGLCPWAERARVQGRTRDAVLLQDDAANVAEALAALDRFAADARVEVGFLLFPRLAVTRAEFDAFTARVRDADAERHELGRIPFVLAAFHPDADADLRDPERLIPFLRRAPDPCIQALRASVLDHVREVSPQGTQLVNVAALEAMLTGAASPPPLRERIARTNLATVQRMGEGALRRTLDDIRADRDATYAALEATMRR